MRVIVVGSGGRLGGAIARHFRPNHRVVVFDRKALDLSRTEIIEDRLLPLNFDLLINTAAVTAVDYCEQHEAEAYAVNASGPGKMAAICTEKGARMVQVSTDYVYDGSIPGAKSETAALDPLGIYAKSKLAGEQAVQAGNATALILRTAWVFGPDRPSFVDFVLDRAIENESVDAIADKFASPTYSNDFAEWLEPLVDRCSSGGIFNVANEGACSWREYAQEALSCAREVGMDLRASHVDPLSITDMEAFVAPRPLHTALSTEKLAAALDRPIRPWNEALRNYIAAFYGKS